MEFLLLLFVKHAIVDLGLQAQLTGIEKSKYFGNGHIHYAHHGLSTLVIAGLFFNAEIAISCAIFDYIVHWQIDYSKHITNNWLQIKTRSSSWWWLNTLDQSLHFITYYIIAKYISAVSFLALW